MAGNNNGGFNNNRTRSGLNPTVQNNKLPFSISTTQVQAYLQKKMDVLCNKDKTLPRHITVNLFTTEAGRSFLPFVITLPMSVVEESSTDESESAIDPIFDNNSDDKIENLKPQIKKLLAPYVYNNKDHKAFASNDWRRARGVSILSADYLKEIVYPRIHTFKFDGEEVCVVICLLDPIRIFHDMVHFDNDNKQYEVGITKWKKVEDQVYKYTVIKQYVNKKSRNLSKQIRRDIAAMLSGRR